MLGIFLIICLVIFWFTKLKAYRLLKDDNIESVEIDSNGRTYNVCYYAVMLHAVSDAVILLVYIGCGWPFLFIEGLSRSNYLLCIVVGGFIPVLSIAYACYLLTKSANGYIKISTEEIEYKRRKSLSVRVSDISKIVYSGLGSYLIYLKEKGKGPVFINLSGFYKKKEISSLMKQLRDYLAKTSGRDVSLSHKLVWMFEMIFGRYYPAFCLIVISLLLIYTSYCCIDYDFFRKDYTALFNNLGEDSNQPENAWPYYVQAAVNYTKLEDDFQEIVEESSRSGQFNFTDEQRDNLRKWFDENASSWASLKKAASVNYCNATYKDISLLHGIDRNDFSSPSNTGYGQIIHLYSNIDACRLAGVYDLGWLDLFKVQLGSSRHFVNGKTFIDQLVGYGLLRKSIQLFAEQDSYTPEELEKARQLLKGCFPANLPALSIEGETFIYCNSYDDIISLKKIPVQTPLNLMFLAFGSSTGTEAYVRKRFANIVEETKKGIEFEQKGISITDFPIMRQMLFNPLADGIVGVYKTSRRANANLLAAYFLLDLEEYKLIRGSYPADVSELRQAGLTSQMPDDPDANGKIIYRNDGQRAILYAVGRNAKDDGGYKDDKSPDKRDDIIYWERQLKEEIEQ
ncbi:MAG: hypothetical protein WC454_05120 [Phycisphaerae bacterium]